MDQDTIMFEEETTTLSSPPPPTPQDVKMGGGGGLMTKETSKQIWEDTKVARDSLPNSFLPPKPKLSNWNSPMVSRSKLLPPPPPCKIRIYVEEDNYSVLCANYKKHMEAKEMEGSCASSSSSADKQKKKEYLIPDPTADLDRNAIMKEHAETQEDPKVLRARVEAATANKRPVLLSSVLGISMQQVASIDMNNYLRVVAADDALVFQKLAVKGYNSRSWITHDWVEEYIIKFATPAAARLFRGVSVIQQAPLVKRLASILAKSCVFSAQPKELQDSAHIRSVMIDAGLIDDVQLDMEENPSEDSIMPSNPNSTRSRLFREGMAPGGCLRPMFSTEAERLDLEESRKQTLAETNAFDIQQMMEDETKYGKDPYDGPIVPGDSAAVNIINPNSHRHPDKNPKWSDELADLLGNRPQEALKKAALAILAKGLLGNYGSTKQPKPATQLLRRARSLSTSGVIVCFTLLVGGVPSHDVILLQHEVARMLMGPSLNTMDRTKTMNDRSWCAYMQWTAPERLSPEEGGVAGRQINTLDNLYTNGNKSEIGFGIKRSMLKLFYRPVTEHIKKLWGAGPLPFEDNMLLQVIQQDIVTIELLNSMRMAHDIVLPVHGAMVLFRSKTTPKWMSAYSQINIWKGILVMTALRTHIDGMEEAKPDAPETLMSASRDKDLEKAAAFGIKMMNGVRNLKGNTFADAIPWCGGWFNPEVYMKPNGYGGVVDKAMNHRSTWNGCLASFQKLCTEMERIAEGIYLEEAEIQLRKEFKTNKRGGGDDVEMNGAEEQEDENLKYCVTQKGIQERAAMLRGRVQQDTSPEGRAESLLVLNIQLGLTKLLANISGTHCKNIQNLRKQYPSQIYAGNGYWIRPLEYYIDFNLLCVSALKQELMVYEDAALAANARWIHIDRADYLRPPTDLRFSVEAVKHVDQHTIGIAMGHRTRAKSARLTYLFSKSVPNSNQLRKGILRLPKWQWKGVTKASLILSEGPTPILNAAPAWSPKAEVWHQECVSGMLDRPDPITYMELIELDQFIDLGDHQIRRKLVGLEVTRDDVSAKEYNDLADAMKKLTVSLVNQGKREAAAFSRQYQPPPNNSDQLRLIRNVVRQAEHKLSSSTSTIMTDAADARKRPHTSKRRASMHKEEETITQDDAGGDMKD